MWWGLVPGALAEYWRWWLDSRTFIMRWNYAIKKMPLKNGWIREILIKLKQWQRKEKKKKRKTSGIKGFLYKFDFIYICTCMYIYIFIYFYLFDRWCTVQHKVSVYVGFQGLKHKIIVTFLLIFEKFQCTENFKMVAFTFQKKVNLSFLFECFFIYFWVQLSKQDLSC